MYSTVVFDLDGTLLNTIDDLADSGNEICRRHGWPTHSIDEFKHFVGNGMVKLVSRFTPADKQQPELQKALLEEFMQYYNAHKQDKTAAYPGIPELLAELKRKGVQIAVFTNKDDGPAQGVMQHYLPGLTDLVRGKVPGTPTKPDPAGLHIIMQQLGADPAKTLYVGDSNVDIFTGHNGGLKACGVLWGFRDRQELQEAGADYLAETTDELRGIILGVEA